MPDVDIEETNVPDGPSGTGSIRILRPKCASYPTATEQNYIAVSWRAAYGVDKNLHGGRIAGASRLWAAT